MEHEVLELKKAAAPSWCWRAGEKLPLTTAAQSSLAPLKTPPGQGETRVSNLLLTAHAGYDRQTSRAVHVLQKQHAQQNHICYSQEQHTLGGAASFLSFLCLFELPSSSLRLVDNLLDVVVNSVEY
eukprot:5524842-Amphidinium_carterae.1